jgi:hypothetical protein
MDSLPKVKRRKCGGRTNFFRLLSRPDITIRVGTVNEMNAINVALLAFPDGSTIYLKDATPDQIRAANKGWRDSLSEDQRAIHQFERTMGGMVMLRMLESDYSAIPATNHPAIQALHNDNSR